MTDVGNVPEENQDHVDTVVGSSGTDVENSEEFGDSAEDAPIGHHEAGKH